ncbi:hypothetical protein, variant [Fonticula alba]|uniref:Signal peptidase complex catalytic subunit SEC11 n=1 Tax=Fonticula alba TaxID=691883 RepID=A0A058ZFS3_FONAL|nr:hypothetical protein, variant [Fonticula alba]KCV72322.1 hypothetical protein, variant [Fonticula alba]|eukprot:XP_009493899.1 hypothetical protein, variant [Fonticula alba]
MADKESPTLVSGAAATDGPSPADDLKPAPQPGKSKAFFPNMRETLAQGLNLLYVVAAALTLWKGLSLLCSTDSPIVVVLSGSMEPAFARGDLLFLSSPSQKNPLRVGDVVVFSEKSYPGGPPVSNIPIVHRVLRVHVDRDTGRTKVLTKGDNNRVDDRALYGKGVEWIDASTFAAPLLKAHWAPSKAPASSPPGVAPPSRLDVVLNMGASERDAGDIVGVVRGQLPKAGLLTLALHDYPYLKIVLVGVLGVLSLFSKDQ